MWELNNTFILLVLCMCVLHCQMNQAQAHSFQFDRVASEKYLELEEDQNVLVENQATAWGLSLADYQHYQDLLRLSWVRLWWRDLDPPHVLGLMAETPDERKKYASIEAALDVKRAERELDFQQAYTDAFRQLYPDAHVINMPENKEP